MRNLRLEIEYRGTDYFGWQYQANKKTIQATIERVLAKILQEPVRIVGAARTDTGVHALGQIANFKTANDLPLAALFAGANSLLPDDIFIKNISLAPESFHARFDAVGKIYRYRILMVKSPLRRSLSWELTIPLSIAAMSKAKDSFFGRKDYSVFCPVKVENPWVDVERISLTPTGDELIIEIEADRFLYKLVRRIVGALVEVGRGKITEDDLIESFSKPPRIASFTAPPEGLVLVAVKY
jgi:tRNA pseudouridine38-40 synthase